MHTQQATHTTRRPSGIAAIHSAARTIASCRRDQDDGPMTVEQLANARREVEYLARRNGIKEPLLQIWTVRS
ncbi:hypothetical protein [Halomonas nitroreducens]|uniref:Uncharacterized protein n=1 Tax=Halomonas nitroreducens TaxID=447425 RepID=A0A3S0JCN2_9GAMM|nr:hypothetical protein [Halomonas nitroreducens]RTR06504.1 hypothetical protein EKG36_03245 [Halomonas nitroreducens]